GDGYPPGGSEPRGAGDRVRERAVLLPPQRPGGFRNRLRGSHGRRLARGGLSRRRRARDRARWGGRRARATAPARGAGPGPGDGAHERETEERSGRGRPRSRRDVPARGGGTPIPGGLRGMSGPGASTTRRFGFSAGHRYWVGSWSEIENRRVFGSLTTPHGH